MWGPRRVAAPVAVLGTSFIAGSVPFSQLAALRFASQDLRRVGSGTVSGTALYEVAGFWPLAAAGILEVAKGAAGPGLARKRRARAGSAGGDDDRNALGYLGALAAGAAVAGHDWSPWLRGAGGRGLSPALGATLVLAPEATVVLVTGMVVGRLLGQTGAVTLIAASSLPVVLGASRGCPGTALGLCVCLPVLAKRVLGNSPLRPTGHGTDGARRALGRRVLSRLLFDRDPECPSADAEIEPTRDP